MPSTTPAKYPPSTAVLEPLSAALDRSRRPEPPCDSTVKAALTPKPRARKRSRRPLETPDMAAMLRRMVRAYGRRCAEDDVEGWLPEALALRADLDAAIAGAVQASHDRHGRSWADIGAAAGTSKQAAAQRWGGTR